MNRIIRVADVAVELFLVNLFGRKREGNRPFIRWLTFKRRPVDGATVQTRRRAGLQSTDSKTQVFKRLRKLDRRGLAGPSSLVRPFAGVDLSRSETFRSRSQSTRLPMRRESCNSIPSTRLSLTIRSVYHALVAS